MKSFALTALLVVCSLEVLIAQTRLDPAGMVVLPAFDAENPNCGGISEEMYVTEEADIDIDNLTSGFYKNITDTIGYRVTVINMLTREVQEARAAAGSIVLSVSLPERELMSRKQQKAALTGYADQIEIRLDTLRSNLGFYLGQYVNIIGIRGDTLFCNEMKEVPSGPNLLALLQNYSSNVASYLEAKRARALLASDSAFKKSVVTLDSEIDSLLAKKIYLLEEIMYFGLVSQ